MTENAKPDGTGRFSNIRIVLVEPTHPGNIGGVARAMKNAFLTDLRLVAPRRFPHPDADARAAGAEEILAQATVTDVLDTSLVGCRLVIGASARRRTIPVPVLDACEAARRLVTEAALGPVALLFGRESNGLTNEEMDRCQYLAVIAANPDFSSLNLACAAQVFGYEMLNAIGGNAGGDVPPIGAAAQEQMRHFYARLEAVMIDLEFLDPRAPRKLMRRLIRLFDRARPDTNELNILEGIVTAIQRRFPKEPPGNI